MSFLNKLKLGSQISLNSLFSLTRLLRDVRLKNSEFIDSVSEQCVLVCNGPSLQQSLQAQHALLQGQTLFMMNKAVCYEEFTILKPAYYILCDNDFFSKQQYLYIYELLAQKVNWPMSLVHPHGMLNKNIRSILQTNSNIKTCANRNTLIEGWDWLQNFCFKYKLGMPAQYNVLVFALMIAIWARFKKILIIAADHNWHSQLHTMADNTVLLCDQHYGEVDKLIPYMLHDDGSSFTMAGVLAFLSATFKSYEIIQQYATQNDIAIINASLTSSLDAFPRLPTL